MKFAFAVIVSLVLQANAQFENLEPLELIAPVPLYPEEQLFKSGRIVGGNEAEPHQFPYQAGVSIHMEDGRSGWCGGSIISEEYILTAAHCTEPAEKGVTITVGAHNIKDENDPGQKIFVPKENLIIHEKWSMLTLTNDISLIRLPYKLNFTDTIQPVNLPKRSQVNEKFVDAVVTASGWGKDTDKATGVSPVLRFVEVPILPRWKCNIFFFGRIKDSHICISGSGGKSTCNGDSGGPLVYKESDGTNTLIGATSFGIAFGCEIGWPGAFTRVTAFLDWINENSGIAIRS